MPDLRRTKRKPSVTPSRDAKPDPDLIVYLDFGDAVTVVMALSQAIGYVGSNAANATRLDLVTARARLQEAMKHAQLAPPPGER